VRVGPPLPTADWVAGHRSAPEEAARALTDRLAAALRAQIVEAEDRETLRLLDLAEAVWREETDERPADEAARVVWRQRVMRSYRYLRAREPARIAAFRRQLE